MLRSASSLASRVLLPLAALLLLAGPAQALSLTLDDCDSMGCEGVSLFASATDNMDGTTTLIFQIDTTGYTPESNPERYGFNQVSVKMLSNDWTSAQLVSAPGPIPDDPNGWLDPAVEATVSANHLCGTGTSSGKICTHGFSSFSIGDVLEWEFLVTGGDIKPTDDWSFMAQFASSADATQGHIISAHSEPIPEPTAALCFGVGLATFSLSRRRRHR